MKLIGVFVLILCSMLSLGCASQMEMQGLSMRKSGASAVALGTIGYVDGGDGKLVPQYELSLASMPENAGRLIGTYEIAGPTRVEVEAAVDKARTDIHADQTWHTAGKYLLIELNTNDLINALNSDANAHLRSPDGSEVFATYGQRAKLVVQTASVFGYYDTRENAVTFSANAPVKRVDGKLTLVQPTHADVKVADGTVIAYRYANVAWRKDEATGKVVAVALVFDDPSKPLTPPAGCTFNLKDFASKPAK